MICLGVSAIVAQTPKRIAFLTDPQIRLTLDHTCVAGGLDTALKAEGYTVDVSYTPLIHSSGRL